MTMEEIQIEKFEGPIRKNKSSSTLMTLLKKMEVGDSLPLAQLSGTAAAYAVAINAWEGRTIFRRLTNSRGVVCIVRVS